MLFRNFRNRICDLRNRPAIMEMYSVFKKWLVKWLYNNINNNTTQLVHAQFLQKYNLRYLKDVRLFSKITALYNNVCGMHIYIEAVLKMHVKLLQGWSMFSYKKNDVFYVRRFNYFLVSTLSLILTGILNSKEKIFFFSLEKNYLSVTGYVLLIKKIHYITWLIIFRPLF